MATSSRTKRFVKKFGGQVMPYRELPVPAQLAIARYMAVDGEAWELPAHTEKWSMKDLEKSFSKLLPYFRKKYGDEEYGYVVVPLKEMEAEILRDPDHVGAKRFSDLGFVLPKKPHSTTNRWPVILNSGDETIIQDGWHRFADYYRQGAKSVPAVYYP